MNQQSQIDDATRQKIESYLDSNRVVLFMKGSPSAPQCGFSAKTSGLLSSLLDDYTHVNVLADEDVREGIKLYGQWPTIPQLYVDRELVGGCDIVTQLYNAGDLHEMLGLDKPDRTPPSITISDQAAENIRAALEGHDNMALHFSIDGNWQAQFSIAPAEGHEVAAEANGLRLLMDLATARRARGAKIDWTDGLQGAGLSIDLPQAPPPVQPISAPDLKKRLDAGDKLLLVDVRGDEEVQQAAFPGARQLDRNLMLEIEQLDKDQPMVFICHHGNSSQGAADHYRRQGYSEVYNLTGGINAWSLEADPDVPQY